ncbi:hypothetical protein Pcinc_022065 [Petrolisthes cinctipes]|uniref:Uncharacterized protein n=1 Tax=Petrolisthes cinctipes TaxID=88211 RepID=A0AAE1FIL3_PETCI|nr:hypothetical protein Pcinc_022065 [Petrolisthes cinctipes]
MRGETVLYDCEVGWSSEAMQRCEKWLGKGRADDRRGLEQESTVAEHCYMRETVNSACQPPTQHKPHLELEEEIKEWCRKGETQG